MKVYIACPAYAVSGGAELLHQLSASLSERNIENYMVYFGVEKGKNPTPERYRKYHIQTASAYVDDVDAVYVLPEVGVHEIDKCILGKAAIWWLSVNNYVMCYRSRFKTTFDIFGVASRKNAYHFVQSQYAKNFLEKYFHVKQSFFLSDYINQDILQYGEEHFRDAKENICIYNPAKGLANVEPLIAASRTDIQWIPLQGFTPLQMAEVMCRAKVYIDFGGHPGKDRIPREAAACGCCIITNREGSANNAVDVKIPDCYKVENVSDMKAVLGLVYQLMDCYEEHISDFKIYRDYIYSEQKVFEQEVEKFITLLAE